MQHLLEDIQADQTKRKTNQQGEDVPEELDCKELKLRLDAARYRFLKQRLVELYWNQQADRPDEIGFKVSFEKVKDFFNGDRSFDDALDASMEEGIHIDAKEIWQEWKLELEAKRYRFLKQYYLNIKPIWNEAPDLCRWEYQIGIEEVRDNLAIDLSFDDAVDALMEKKNG